MNRRLLLIALSVILCSLMPTIAQTVLWQQTYGSLPLKRVALSKYGVWLAVRNDSTVALFDGMGNGILDTFKMPGVDAIMPSPDGEYVYGIRSTRFSQEEQQNTLLCRRILSRKDTILKVVPSKGYMLYPLWSPPYSDAMFFSTDHSYLYYGGFIDGSSGPSMLLTSYGGSINLESNEEKSTLFPLDVANNSNGIWMYSHGNYDNSHGGRLAADIRNFNVTYNGKTYPIDNPSNYYGLTYNGRFAATRSGIFDYTVKHIVSPVVISGRYISDRYVLYMNSAGILRLYDIVTRSVAYSFDSIVKGNCTDFDVIENNTIAAIYDSTIVVFRLSDNLQPMQTVTDFVASDTLAKLGNPIIFENYTYPPDSVVSYEWDFGDGTKSSEQFPGHLFTEAGIYSITLNVRLKNGKTIIVTKPSYIRIPAPQQPLKWLKNMDSMVIYTLTFSPDSKTLAVGGVYTSIPLLDVGTGVIKQHHDLSSKGSATLALRFSNDGSSLYQVGFEPFTTKKSNGNLQYMYSPGFTTLYVTGFSSDTIAGRFDKFNYYGNYKIFRYLFNIDPSPHTLLVSDICNPSIQLNLSLDEKWLLISYRAYQQTSFDPQIKPDDYNYFNGAFGTLLRYDLLNGTGYFPDNPKIHQDKTWNITFRDVDTSYRAVFSVATTADNGTYVTSENRFIPVISGENFSTDYIPYWLFVKDIATGNELRRYRDSSRCIRQSPDGFHILTRSGLWDVFTGKVVQKLDIGDLDRFEYLPDGVHVAAFFGGDSAAVRIFNIQKNQYVYSFGRLPNKARCMAVSPNGKYIAIGLEQNNVALVEVPSFSVADKVDFALPMFNNPIENQSARFVNTTLPANENFTFAWDFGDGAKSEERSPHHAFTTAGRYRVTLTAFRSGVSIGSITKDIDVQSVSGVEDGATVSMQIEPNPADESFSVRCVGTLPKQATLYDALGNMLATNEFSCAAGECAARFPTSDLASGVYYCVITSGTARRVLSVCISR